MCGPVAGIGVPDGKPVTLRPPDDRFSVKVIENGLALVGAKVLVAVKSHGPPLVWAG